jgi:ribonuclease P protein component
LSAFAFPLVSTGTRAEAAPVKPQAFPKSARLLKHADFERVYNSGERLFCKDLTVFFVRGGQGASEAQVSSGAVRIGLTVGRALGGAVVRNRIKRRMREALRKHLQELSSPADIVVNPKKSAAVAELAELENQVRQSFAAIERGERGERRAAVSRPPGKGKSKLKGSGARSR